MLKKLRQLPTNRGFSLIEVLVSTSLLVLLLMTATTMMLTFLVSNAKTSVRHTVKGEGSFALAQIEHLIRNAETVSANCGASGSSNSSITLKQFNDSDSYLISTTANAGGTTQISSTNQTTASTEYLTSSEANVSLFNLKCYGVASQDRRIEITFTLSRSVSSIQANATPIEEQFRSVVQIRN